MTKTHAICIGNRNKVQIFLSGHSGYYVYVLRRPDQRPFYVGKGIGSRVFHHETEARHDAQYGSNPYKINVIQKIKRSGKDIIYEIDSMFDDEQNAYDREAELIEGFGRLHESGPLTNLAAGGGSAAGPSPFSKERHQKNLGGIPDDDPERAIINSFLLSIGKPKSICIKVVGRTTKPKPTKAFAHTTRKPTKRQALALVASATAEGVELEQGCKIPRKFTYENVTAFVENGVSNDIATSGMATVVAAADPIDEYFVLDKQQIETITNLVGRSKLEDLGIR